MIGQNPVVSISCITFNHAPYIRECLDGFLMQKTTFPFEVVIYDDCSTDGTKEIIEEYTSKYPDIFFPMIQTENQYSKGVRGMMARFNFPRCRGKYIALCEGDDYWTDSGKLQKQVGFLENNPDFNLVGHYALDSFGKTRGKHEKDTFAFEDIYYRNFIIPTASMVFRNNLVFPGWTSKIYGGDRAIIYLNAEKGKLKILPFMGSFYRIHEGGMEQVYKKDKFKLPIRNINEEIVYYEQIKHLPKHYILSKRIVKNHLYILAQSVGRFEMRYFFMAFYSLLLFLTVKQVKVKF
ncbi:MAG: glycosyltransferase [Flavobacterium sp.]